jgi:hypothetical protein
VAATGWLSVVVSWVSTTTAPQPASSISKSIATFIVNVLPKAKILKQYTLSSDNMIEADQPQVFAGQEQYMPL